MGREEGKEKQLILAAMFEFPSRRKLRKKAIEMILIMMQQVRRGKREEGI